LCEATATTGVFAAPHVVMKASAVKTLEMKDLEMKDLEINNLEMNDLETKNSATTHDFAAVRPCAQKKAGPKRARLKVLAT
jgi:hypothetical protein